MKKDYKKQIFVYNVKKFDLMVSNDIHMFPSMKTFIKANKNVILQVNFINGGKNIIKDLK